MDRFAGDAPMVIHVHRVDFRMRLRSGLEISATLHVALTGEQPDVASANPMSGHRFVPDRTRDLIRTADRDSIQPRGKLSILGRAHFTMREAGKRSAIRGD